MRIAEVVVSYSNGLYTIDIADGDGDTYAEVVSSELFLALSEAETYIEVLNDERLGVAP